MLFKNKLRGSKEVMIMTSGVIILFVFSVITIVTISFDLADYSTLINEAGRMRGGIQRIVKLEISDVHDESLINEIDLLILKAKNIELKLLYKITKNREYTNLLKKLELNWLSFKTELTGFRNNTFSTRDLVKDSEKLWEISNSLVSKVESIAHFTVALYYMVAVVMLFGVLSLGFVLFITKYSIRDKIEYLADHDQLTGLFNRHFFNNSYEREYLLANRNNRAFSVLLCDIDHFKHVNDKFGHDIGDDVLRSVANTLKANSRESDLIARYGGEEIIILCVDIEIDKIMNHAERLRNAIENLNAIKDYKVTISIGISAYSQGLSKNQIIKKADIALYKAKEEGRNKVVLNP